MQITRLPPGQARIQGPYHSAPTRARAVQCDRIIQYTMVRTDSRRKKDAPDHAGHTAPGVQEPHHTGLTGEGVRHVCESYTGIHSEYELAVL